MMQNSDNSICLNSALRYLELRPRSEQEVRDYLIKKQKFSGDTINKVVSQLKETNLINDSVFAELWSSSRNEHKPKSQSMVRYELIKKGIAPDIAEKAVLQLKDTDNAYKLGMKKAVLIKSADYREFYRQLSGFLARRGFNQDIISITVKKIWQNLNNCRNPDA